MRCWVYVDGFNFYHGAAKRTGHKWVDLLKLSQQVRSGDSIERIKYFTALVERRTDDPDQQKRQRLYWRALATIPCLERIEGQFSRHPRSMPLYDSVQTLEELARRGCNVEGVRPIMMRMLRSEEKGTDVNLATHLVHDAHRTPPADSFEGALVISNDSDLAEAIRIVTREVGKRVYVCVPDSSSRIGRLAAVATGVFGLNASVLRDCLFPDTLADARGPFCKPPNW